MNDEFKTAESTILKPQSETALSELVIVSETISVDDSDTQNRNTTPNTNIENLFDQVEGRLKTLSEKTPGRRRFELQSEGVIGSVAAIVTIVFFLAVLAAIGGSLFTISHIAAYQWKRSLTITALALPLVSLILCPAFLELAKLFEGRKSYSLAEVSYLIPVWLTNLFPQLHFTSSELRTNLCSFYANTGQIRKAARIIKSEIRRQDEDDKEVLSKLANRYAAQAGFLSRVGELAAAQGAAEKAINCSNSARALDLDRLKNDNIQFNRNLGAFYEHAGLSQIAIKHYATALENVLANTNDTDLMISLIACISSVLLKKGEVRESLKWLQAGQTYLDATKFASYCRDTTQINFFTTYGGALIAADRLTEAKDIFLKAEKLTSLYHKSLDFADLLTRQGQLEYKLHNVLQAEDYFKKSQNIRDLQHQSLVTDFVENVEGYLSVLESLDKQVPEAKLRAALVHAKSERALFENSQAAASGKPTATHLFLKSRRKFGLFQWLFMGYLVSQALLLPILDGCRAAGPDSFIALKFIFLTAISVAAILAPKWSRIYTHRKRISKLKQVNCLVSFKRQKSSPSDLQIIAELREPFDTTRPVIEKFRVFKTNLQKLAGINSCVVYFDENDEPLYLDTSDGLLQLASRELQADPIFKAQRKDDARVASMLKAALVPLAFCALAFLFTSFQYTNPRAGHLPQNLTAFEYYRLGVRLSNQGYKPDYEDLLAAKESLLKASTIDKNGIIGRLAGNYEKFELPGFIPSNMVLEVYDAATQNYEREEIGAEDKLRRIIKIAPQFDWAYTKLAEILIDKKEYAEAEQLLAKANELNANSVNYLVTLSKLKSAAGNKGAAIALLKEAIDEDPTNLHLYQGYIYEWVTDEQH